MIIALLNCTLTPLSKDTTTIFKLSYIKNEKYCTQKIGLRCCVIQNNNRSIHSIFVQKAKHVLTFVFSTLYTKIPHNKLLFFFLNSIIEFAFTGGTRDKHICVK